MWLRLLVPLTLLLPVLAMAAEGTGLRRYRATPLRELAALTFCIVAFFALWIGLHALFEATSNSALVVIVAATLLALIAVPVLLYIGYKLFGVRPAGASGTH